MASTDILLLALLSNKENYNKYRDLISNEAILLSDTATYLADFKAYYDAFPSEDDINWEQFKTYTSVIRHPDWKPERWAPYEGVLEHVKTTKESGVGIEILGHFTRVDAANKIAEICSDIAYGKSDDFSPIIEIAGKVKREATVTDDLSGLFGPTDLSALLETRIRSGGVEWRLDALNISAGPLHAGDFVMLAARPEAGKTSWICSELTHMVKSLPADKDAVIFNPEEGGGRVFLRLVTAATDKDIIEIASDEANAKTLYEAEVGRMDRIKVVEPPGGITTRDVDRVLDTGKYGLVAINVVDKIRLPSKYSQETDVARFRSLAYWLRETANRYSVPILAVVQAGDAAEGQRYLTQSMIYGSRTGVQGEVDLLLGMGYDPSIDSRRYLSLLKNKLPGGLKTNPLLKHAKLEVEFNPATGRYKDI